MLQGDYQSVLEAKNEDQFRSVVIRFARHLGFDKVAATVAVDKVGVSKERYSTGGAKAEIVNNLVLMFMAEDGMDTEDASNIKRFVSPCEGGGKVRVYERHWRR